MKANTKATKIFLRFKTKTQWIVIPHFEILVAKSSAFEEPIREELSKLGIFLDPDTGGVEELFKNINRTYHTLVNGAAQKAHTSFRFEEAEIVMNGEKK